jgi:ubiquitin-like modifier-activating enzyme ATG7
MEQTVDLNLKLIRWRQAPSIDLDRFTSLRVLILGSGTLGCNIARALLGWGVRRFTFIDHAFVSYNNPVRQSLFAFRHCQSANNPKAEVAAQALKDIYPLVEARGRHMKVPMPGYPYSEEGNSFACTFSRELAFLLPFPKKPPNSSVISF